MKYTTIFFDLDDTLVDTAQNNKEALRDIYTDYKFDEHYPGFDVFYRKFQSINLNLWDLYAHNKITKDTLKITRFMDTLKGSVEISPEESLKMNDDFLERVNTKKNVIEGVKDILEYLKPKYQLYILSNGFEEVQDHKMRNANLKPYFEKVILSDHIGVNKPSPQIFNYALDQARVSNNSTIMIGDNINTDIMGAKNSNIDQVWYNPGNLADEYNIKPTYTIQNLGELKQIL